MVGQIKKPPNLHKISILQENQKTDAYWKEKMISLIEIIVIYDFNQIF